MAISAIQKIDLVESNTTHTVTFGTTATIGSRLVLMFTASANPGTVTGPSGWTEDYNSGVNAPRSVIWSKVSDGTETSVTFSHVTNRTVDIYFYELSGFVGGSAIDVQDSNISLSTVTSLTTGSGVATTSSDGFAVLWFGRNGVSTALSLNSGFTVESNNPSGRVTVSGMAISSPTLLSVTNSWTTARTATGALVVYKSSGSPLSGIGVWDGTEWTVKPVKVWNGSSWVVKPLKRWNGSSWV